MSNCGTYSGYIIHGRNKEKPCEQCRLAANKYRREKRKNDNEKIGYDPRRFRRHNITKEEYDSLLLKNDKKCWICSMYEAVHIDHDHKCCAGSHSCGKCIRGVLCSNCNTAIGLMGESIERFKKAIKYLS